MDKKVDVCRLRLILVCLAGLSGCQPAELLEAGDASIVGSAPVVAVRNGRAVATWHRSGSKVHATWYEAPSGWSAPEVIGTGTFPDVAVSSGDSAIALFASTTSLRAAMRGPAGWAAPTTLGTGTSLAYGVAMEGGGSAVAVWSDGSQVNIRNREGGVWTGATMLSGSGSLGRPQVVVNDSGVAFAAWCSASGIIRGVRRVAPGPWGSVFTSLSDCCQSPFLDTPGPGVSLGVSASGDAVIVGGTATRVCEKRYVTGSGWQPTTVLATPGADATAPQVAVSPDGHALLAWNNTSAGSLIKARAYDPVGGWGPVLTGPAAGHGRLGVGIGSTGEGAIVYRASGISRVLYSEGALTAPDVVDSGSGAYYLRVGFDPNESVQGVSVWQRAGGGGAEAIWASRVGL